MRAPCAVLLRSGIFFYRLRAKCRPFWTVKLILTVRFARNLIQKSPQIASILIRKMRVKMDLRDCASRKIRAHMRAICEQKEQLLMNSTVFCKTQSSTRCELWQASKFIFY